MRKLATIDTIQEVKEIPGAEKIDAYRVRNWWVVDAKAKYNPGDVVVFIEPDAWMPKDEFPFLFRDGERVKEFNCIPGKILRTQRFLGQISQGLITTVKPEINAGVGDDVSEYYNIVKYEAPESANFRGNEAGAWPHHLLPKTDQERVQNVTYPWHSSMLTVSWHVEMKLDGSSTTVYFDAEKEDVFVCSRNLVFGLDVDNTFVNTAKANGLVEFVRANPKLALRGELVGPGVQKNRDCWPKHRIFVFDVYNIEEQHYLPRPHVCSLVDDFGNSELEVVPSVLPPISLQDYDVESLLELSNVAGINAHSSLSGFAIAEGIVLKPDQPFKSGHSFKVINPEYLIKTKQ